MSSTVPFFSNTTLPKASIKDLVVPVRCSGLAAQTIAGLRQTFTSIGHAPTVDMWAALEAVATTLERMTTHTAEPVVYLSSLDPGVGKTSTVIHFIQSLLRSPLHGDSSVLVCVRRREQIRAIVEEAALTSEDFAVLTADAELNLLGSCNPSHARVLFTTHSMIESRCEDRAFSAVSAFHFRDVPRDVRIWDEAILPGRTLTISRDELGFLFKPLRSRHPDLAAAVEELFQKLGEILDGTQLPIPDLADIHHVWLNDALQLVNGGPADQVAAVETLWFLFGKTVTVRTDGKYGNTILDYKDTLPDDILPLLALDASARVRTTYHLWEERGGIEVLPSAAKRYDNHTCHVWKQAGGKSAFRTNGPSLIDGIVKTILTRPDEEWLIVYHKNGLGGLDVPSAIAAFLPCNGPIVHFLNWGSHDATNAYAAVPNVILAGTLFYRTSYYEALGRLAAGQPSSSGPFSSKDTEAVRIGENCHLILQALCRGAVRRCVDGGCPETRSYIIASQRSGIAEALPDIFPGVRMASWRPIERHLSGSVGKAVRYIKQRLTADPEGLVPFGDVKTHIGCGDQSNFNRMIRKHADFRQTLADENIIEWGPLNRMTGFRAAASIFSTT
ncbi:hypothetical protein V1282_005275 [Nitrobacteraceae bacterium AZCC 2146]